VPELWRLVFATLTAGLFRLCNWAGSIGPLERLPSRSI